MSLVDLSEVRANKAANGSQHGASPRSTEVMSAEARTRYSDGWRAGKPAEDPEKMKRWGLIAARPSEFLIHMRGGRMLNNSSGQGASCFKWPWDSVAIVPTTVQKLRFTADQVTNEKVGVSVTGLAVYRIADPVIAFRMLNFSFPERASEKLEQMLTEMFVGAARRLVANLSVEQCLTKRKEGIAAELMREIAPVVSGSGRPDDRTIKGWGVVIDTIEIQDVRILSQAVFTNMQARYRQDQERQAREAELSTDRAVKHSQTEAERQVALAKLHAEMEVKQKRQSAEEEARLGALAAEARLAEAKLAHERGMALARMQAEVEKARLETEAAAARHAAEMAASRQKVEVLEAQLMEAHAHRSLKEAQVELAQLHARQEMVEQEVELSRSRGTREIENTISQEAIQLAIAQQLPELAAAFQQKMGQVNITSIDGANPFGYVASAIQAVMGMAKSAGLSLPEAKPTKA